MSKGDEYAVEEFKLTPEQGQHLERIKDTFGELVTAKYFQGARHHGGNLWDNPHILDEAIDEAIDLVVYLLTIREKLI